MKTLLIILVISDLLFCQTIDFVNEFGKFSSASSFDLDLQGNFYVADNYDNTIVKLDSTGKIINSIGGFGWETSTFDQPSCIFTTTLSTYVADKNNNRIQRFDKDLNFLSEYSGNNNSDIEFAYPTCLSISNIGDLFLLESDNYRILKFSLNGNFLIEIGAQDAGVFALSDPKNFTLDNDGNIFVLDEDQIKVFDQYGNGKLKFKIKSEPNKIYFYEKHLYFIERNKISSLDLIERKKNDQFYELQELQGEEIIDIKISQKNLFVLSPTKIFKYNFNR
ncbi:MAG: NHL repeat-containing protein [Melioribacteraceae bacterium]|nr:NHL repeat-containing protein [Melioribacteraceae bacterium]